MFQVTLGWIDRWLGIYKIKVRNLRYYFSRLLRLPRSYCPRLYQICYSPPWLLRPLRLCWQHLLHPQCCLQWKINKVTHFFSNTVFPHIVAAATILFWIHLVRKLFKFSFPLCNENLNSFLTRWGNYSRRGNYSREETIWGNTVFGYCTSFLA